MSEQNLGGPGGPAQPGESVGPAAGMPGQPAPPPATQYPPPAAPAQPGQPPRETLGSAPAASDYLGQAPQPPQASQAVGTPPPAKRKRRGLLWVLVGIAAFLVFLVIAFVAAAIFLFGDSPATAEVGSCLSGTTDTAALDPDDMSVVACDSTEASYKVIGRIEDKTQQESETACQGVAGTELSLWYGAPGQRGITLCLARLAP